MEISTEKLAYLAILSEASAFCDVSAPVKIPGVQPDVNTIIDCFGTVLMKSKGAEGGRLYVRGEVEFQILYVSDDNEVYKATTKSDYECVTPCDETENPYDIEAFVKLASCDCVADSHGELTCRGKIAAEIICYEHKTCEICKDVEAPHVYVKMTDVNLTVLSDYTEKTFIVSDEMTISGKADEILSCYSEVNVTGYTFSAGKLIAKGNVITSLLYLTENEIYPMKKQYTSEFSQIIDIETKNPAEAKITPMVTGIYTELGADSDSGDSTMECEVRAVLQCAVFEEKQFEIVTDLYGTRSELLAEKEKIRIISPDKRTDFEAETTFTADNIHNASRILTYRAGTGNSYKAETGMSTAVNVVVSYADSDGSVHIEKLRNEFVWESENIGTISVKSLDVKTINGSIEVHIHGIMTVTEKSAFEISNITGISESGSTAFESMPSIVLVRAGSDTDLWAVCKKHCSCKELVMDLNKLESEELEDGKFILVPRV